MFGIQFDQKYSQNLSQLIGRQINIHNAVLHGQSPHQLKGIESTIGYVSYHGAEVSFTLPHYVRGIGQWWFEYTARYLYIVLLMQAPMQDMKRIRGCATISAIRFSLSLS